jgi:glycosyltransferase involved in cell wall biosynthesis
VRTYLAKAHVSVAPFTIAAGIQNKILEAMSYGLPVVAFSRAVQGLSKGVAGGIETAESAEEMARKIILLLGNPELARQQGMEARQRVTAEYRWDEALAGLLRLVEDPSGAARSTVRVVPA